MMENSSASSLCPSPVCLIADNQGKVEPQGEGAWVPESPPGGQQSSGREHLLELSINGK